MSGIHFSDATAPVFADALPSHRREATTVRRWHFADVADMAAAAPIGDPPRAWNRYQGAHLDDADSWIGCKGGFAGAHRMARDGWPEGAERARRVRDALAIALPALPRLTRYDVAGQIPDVRRAIAGNPQAMRRPQPDSAKRRPVLTLACSTAVSWQVNASVMVAQAAVNCAIADALEDAGYSVEIFNIIRAQSSGGAFVAEAALRIKVAGAPLSLSNAAYGMGHTAIFRGLALALFAADTECTRLGGCLGFPVSRMTSDPARNLYTLPSVQEKESPLALLRASVAVLHKQECPGIPAPETIPAHLPTR